MERKYEGPLAPNENGAIMWPDNLAWLQELSEGTLIPAMAKQMERTEEERVRDRARSRDSAKRTRCLENLRSKLTKRYPDQWVALGEDWVLVVARSREELRAKLEERGVHPGYAVRKFMNTKPPRRIPG